MGILLFCWIIIAASQFNAASNSYNADNSMLQETFSYSAGT